MSTNFVMSNALPYAQSVVSKQHTDKNPALKIHITKLENIVPQLHCLDDLQPYSTLAIQSPITILKTFHCRIHGVNNSSRLPDNEKQYNRLMGEFHHSIMVLQCKVILHPQSLTPTEQQQEQVHQLSGLGHIPTCRSFVASGRLL